MLHLAAFGGLLLAFIQSGVGLRGTFCWLGNGVVPLDFFIAQSSVLNSTDTCAGNEVAAMIVGGANYPQNQHL